MAFRFPGGANDEDSMWRMLNEGKHGISRIPEDRWPVEELQHPKRSEPGRSVTFAAGVLSQIDQFDAVFFGISPREAAWLDPQQRLLLEMSYEAMEDAGVKSTSLAGSRCGVYIGISGMDYGQHALDDLASMTAYSMTGNTLSIAANRLSYVFDLHGPSMAVDTACSSAGRPAPGLPGLAPWRDTHGTGWRDKPAHASILLYRFQPCVHVVSQRTVPSLRCDR